MDESSERGPLDRIVFVLDRPQDATNVGAVVRLMGNFGLGRLRLVEPAAFDRGRILALARRGHAVLDGVVRFPRLEDALADCGFVLGTTSRARVLPRPVLTPRLAAAALLAVTVSAAVDTHAAGDARPLAAVLFGPEDVGLANSAIDRCNALLRIPTVPHDASLNLAQAALLVAYELFLAGQSAEDPDHAGAATQSLAASLASGDAVPAEQAALESLFGAARRMVDALYGEKRIAGRTDVTLSRLRALLLRAAPRPDEAALLTTLFEHAAAALAARGDL